jgi:hypothetical protein
MREFRDLDLMLRFQNEGPMKAKDLATSMGGEEYGRHLGSRLAWMRRYGILDLSPKQEWDLTQAGHRVILARKRARLMDELAALPTEELIEVMAAVIARSQKGDPMIGIMLRREFIFGTGRTL